MTIEVLTICVGLATVVVACLSLAAASRSSSDSQNLQVILQLSESYRHNWENGWNVTLGELEKHNSQNVATSLSQELQLKVRSYLNWIDWYGNILQSRLFRKSDVFTKAVGPSMLRAINASREMIASDVKEHGQEHWSGLLFVAKMLNSPIVVR